MRVGWLLVPVTVTVLGCGSSSERGRTPEPPVHQEIPADDGAEATRSVDESKPPDPKPNTGNQFAENACDGWLADPAVRIDIGDTNDTSSAARAREALLLGFAPSPALIRTRDFFNFYSGSEPAPGVDAPVVSLELRERLVPAEYDLLVTLSAPAAPRPRSVLTVLVDTTPSMAGAPIARARMTVKSLGAALVQGDSLTILTTDLEQGVRRFDLSGVPGELDQADGWLEESTSGDLAAALGLAYDLAHESLDPKASNRVVFLSDGAEPVEALPGSVIDAGLQDGIRLVGIGTAPTLSYRDRLLSKATLLGRGAHAYVDSEAEAQILFAKRFDELFSATSDNLRLELGLPSFLRRVAEQLPDVGTDTAEAASQPMPNGASLRWLVRLEACDAAAHLNDPGAKITATFRRSDPVTGAELPPISGAASASPLPAGAASPALDKALATKAYVEALSSVNKQRIMAALEAVTTALSSNSSGTSPDPDLKEMQELLEAHPAKSLP